MDGDDPTPEELRERQGAEEAAAEQSLREAATDEEALTSLRRAEKARYLRGKLEEQERADRERDADQG